MSVALVVACGFILLLLILLVRSELVRRLELVEQQVINLDGRLATVERFVEKEADAIESAVARAVQPMCQRLEKQELDISEVKDMLLFLVSKGEEQNAL